LRQTYFLLVICLLSLCLFSCKKNDGVNQHLDPHGQLSYDFMPKNEGSWWRYGSQTDIPYNRYARNKDSVMLGLTYRYYERKDDSAHGFQPEYFGKNNNFYLTLIDLDGSASNYVNYVYWKDSATLHTSWTNTASVNSPIGNVTITMSSSVAEYAISMTFSGQTFTNVMHVHSDCKGGLFNTNLGTLDVWFVKGLGIIREEANFNLLNQYKVKHTDSLIDYHIEP